MRLVGGLFARKRASNSLKPSGALLATKAQYAPIGDRAGIGRGKRKRAAMSTNRLRGSIGLMLSMPKSIVCLSRYICGSIGVL